MSGMQGMYSMRSPAVKRLMKEAQELREPTEQYHAQPLEDNLFEWHFTIRGPGDSEFDEGLYHGRIVLPPEYPMKPPSIILLTPNGRFEIFKKICLSISGHHPESWQPSWSIRTALLAIIGFMPTHGAGAIGSLDYSKEERIKLAKRSVDWKCSTCGKINNVLKPVTSASQKTRQEAKELAAQINFQGEKSTASSPEPKNPAPESRPVTSQATAPPTTSTQQTGQTQPPPFGQYPFMSPFIQHPFNPASPSGQNLNTGVMGIPRFPPPPPVIPALFPPGMLPNYGFGGIPTFPNSPFPIPNRGLNKTSTNPATSQSNPQPQSSSESIPQSSSERLAPEPIVTQPANEVVESASGSANDKDKCVNSDDVANDNALEEPVIQQSETQTVEQEENQTNFTTTEIPGGVRQRTGLGATDMPAPPVRLPTGTVGQNAELQRDTNRDSNWHLSTLLIVILSLAIGLLLLRRFILSRTWRFYYGL